MESEWQVCELEETVYNAFDRFTVSTVPEIWIVRREDESLVCYWPNKNAERKIRKRQPPEEGGTYYKCRILFDGAKFSSFKKANAAEIVAQNYSIMDCSAVANDQDKLNSTMHFDVSDVPETLVDCMNGTLSTVDGDNEDQIVGNDSFEFNKLMLRKSIAFEVADIADCDNLPSVPTLPEYEALFQTNNEFLTSTALDDSDSAFGVDGTSCLGVDNIDLVNARVQTIDDLILSKISSIESTTFSLMKSLQDVKEMVQRRAAERNRDDASVNRVEVLSVETIKMPKNTLNDKFVTTSQIADCINKVQDIEVLFDQGDGHLLSLTREDSNGQNALGRSRSIVLQDNLPNYQFQDHPLLTDGDNDGSLQRENVLHNDSDLVKDQNDVHLVEEVPNNSNNNHSEQHPTTVVLPVNTIAEYQVNEDILELDDGAKSDLVERMKPQNEEGEANYMNRIVFVAFTTNFLLKHLSWKAEKERVNLRHGNFLTCWKQSYEGKYGPDEKNGRVQQHIRRLKGTKRAAVKRLERNSQPKKPKGN